MKRLVLLLVLVVVALAALASTARATVIYNAMNHGLMQTASGAYCSSTTVCQLVIVRQADGAGFIFNSHGNTAHPDSCTIYWWEFGGTHCGSFTYNANGLVGTYDGGRSLRAYARQRCGTNAYRISGTRYATPNLAQEVNWGLFHIGTSCLPLSSPFEPIA